LIGQPVLSLITNSLNFNTNLARGYEKLARVYKSPGYQKYSKASKFLGYYFDKAVANLDAGVTTLNERSRYHGEQPRGTKRYDRVLGAEMPLIVSEHQPLHGQDVIATTSGEASMPGPKGGKRPFLKRGSGTGGGKGRPQERKSGRSTVSIPAARVTTNRNVRPSIRNVGNSVRIVHRELIDTVLCHELFSTVSYHINPGLSATFPWLSSQSKGFERYKFNSLMFEYCARVGTNFAGSVLLAPDYDPVDDPPSSEKIMSAYEGSIESASYHDFGCELSVRDMLGGSTSKYLRYSISQAGTTLREYDAGTFIVATTDFPTANEDQAAGKLWVYYDVTLMVPRELDIFTEAYLHSANIVSGGTVSQQNPWGTTPTVAGGLDIELKQGGTAVITFNTPGIYAFVTHVTGTVLSTGFVPTITSAEGTAIIANFYGVSNAAANAGTNAVAYTNSVQVVTPGDQLTINFTAVATTITACTFNVYTYSATATE